MKTPKRKFGLDKKWTYYQQTRWKRKNREAQYKRTIARLTAESRKFRELWRGEHLKDYSPEWDAFMILRRLKTPAEDATLDEKFEYWITLREVGKLALNAACLAAMAYGKAEEKENAACHPETEENGQQTELPPTGGQQPCLARNAENAKQATLICTDATRKQKRKLKQ